MKKNKILKIFKIKANAFLFFCFFVWIASAVGWDVISQYIPTQTTSNPGSSSSLISFTASDSNADAAYINKWNNSTIIWNYFEWYYYDSVFWFFKLDWTDNPRERVSVVSATSACVSSYGYKLWGYAYSEDFWFMDFDYNSDVFVYYCEWDKELHGYAYSKTLWFQNFEWIQFEITPNVWTIVENTSTWVFVNDTTQIESIQIYTWSTSNFDYNSIWWDINEFDTTKESIFYIIK